MKLQVRLFLLLIAVISLPGGPVLAQSAHYELVNLGTLRGGQTSNGHAINNLGEVTGRSTTEQWYYRGFFWSESTGMLDLRTLGGPESEGWGINDHSQVVGETTDQFGYWHAFLWEASHLTSAYSAGYGSGGWSINNDGVIVGWNDSVFGTAGFVRLPDGTIHLGEVGSEFYDINDPAPGVDALAGGFWRNPTTGTPSPVAYDTGLNVPLLSPDGGLARGVNRDGTLVGYQGGLPIFSKASDGYSVQFAPLVDGYDSGRFFKINNAGLMVGYNRGTNLPGIGVIYAEGGEPTDINTLFDAATRSAWQVDTLRDANDHGFLTGSGTHEGFTLAVLLRPLDADDDGLDYYEEVYIHGTDPDIADTDDDDFDDGYEIEAGTDPLDPASVPPTITVVSPNGGEALVRGSSVELRWSTTGVVGSSVKIVLRRDAYAGTLFGATPNDGVQNWNIPASYPVGSGFTLEISSTADPSITDTSDGSFSVVEGIPSGSISLVSPNGGEAYLQGATVPITWSSTGNPGAMVEILAHGGGGTFPVAATTANDGAFDWVIPVNQPPGTDYTIQVRSTSNPSLGDTSNSAFSIQEGTTTGSITVLSPNGGEYLLRGTTVELRWSSTGVVGSAVKIVLRRGSYSGTLFGATPNDGVQNWNIPASYPVNSGFSLEISAATNPAIKDVSDGTFSVTDTPPTASITITAPNGGEAYAQEDTLPITWTSSGDAGAHVQILAHGAGQTFVLADATENDGAFDWAIPTAQPDGTDYTVEVRSVEIPGVSDNSNSPFRISGVTLENRITVLSPNGGEVFVRGTAVQIRWDSVGQVGSSVKIVLRRGAYTGTLFGATPNDGIHNWNIPSTYPVASGFTIEISSVDDPAIVDGSDTAFSIVTP